MKKLPFNPTDAMADQYVWDPLRKKKVALTPEEKVRQWFISILLVQAHVPSQLMMSEVSMKFGRKKYRADILVYGRDLRPVMAVECKREDVELSQEVIDQALRYDSVLGARLLAITNGKCTKIYRKGESGFEEIPVLPEYKDMD